VKQVFLQSDLIIYSATSVPKIALIEIMAVITKSYAFRWEAGIRND
jgi:hypothetical protein